MDLYDDILTDDLASVENDENAAKMRDIIANIELLTPEFLEKVHAETITELTQQQYNGYLTHLYIFYFKPSKVLYKHFQGMSNDHRITILYNDELLTLLCIYYIYMSECNNKIANISGFSRMTGISLETFNRWEGLKDQRPRAYELIKSLRKAYETGLENGAQSGKNPVGYIAALNHRFGWSADNKPSLTVNITRSQDQILQSFDTALITEKPATP